MQNKLYFPWGKPQGVSTYLYEDFIKNYLSNFQTFSINNFEIKSIIEKYIGKNFQIIFKSDVPSKDGEKKIKFYLAIQPYTKIYRGIRKAIMIRSDKKIEFVIDPQIGIFNKVKMIIDFKKLGLNDKIKCFSLGYNKDQLAENLPKSRISDLMLFFLDKNLNHITGVNPTHPNAPYGTLLSEELIIRAYWNKWPSILILNSYTLPPGSNLSEKDIYTMLKNDIQRYLTYKNKGKTVKPAVITELNRLKGLGYADENGIRKDYWEMQQLAEKVIRGGKYRLLNQKVFSKEKLKLLSKEQLRIMRNTIFARYDYRFKSYDLAKHFGQFDWFIPMYDNVDDKLTEIERKNARLMLEVEREKKK
jgi:hypothetical protein